MDFSINSSRYKVCRVNWKGTTSISIMMLTAAFSSQCEIAFATSHPRCAKTAGPGLGSRSVLNLTSSLFLSNFIPLCSSTWYRRLSRNLTSPTGSSDKATQHPREISTHTSRHGTMEDRPMLADPIHSHAHLMSSASFRIHHSACSRRSPTRI